MDQNSELIFQTIRWGPAIAKILLAAFLGALIGVERLWGDHPAGLRTNMMISVASCLFTILSIEGFPLRGSAQDTARIAAQIVTGVGFLGAGALLQTKRGVRGLTTAATIWLVAAIGMAVGTGAYFVSIFTTVVAVIVLILLSPVSNWLEYRARLRREMRQSEPKAATQRKRRWWEWFRSPDDEEDESGD